MSYDIPSVSELEAVQLLNKHYAEVITSKKDGIASGSDITQTTNPITGVVRRTLYKILDDMDDTFLERLLKMAFTRVGTFTAGATLTDMRQVLVWEASKGGDGHEYGWTGSFPKVVTAGATPETSGGIGAGAWVDRTDDSLRSDLANPDTGAAMIGFKQDWEGAVNRTLENKVRDAVSVSDFKASNETEISGALQNAVDAGFFAGSPVSINEGNIAKKISSPVTLRPGILSGPGMMIPGTRWKKNGVAYTQKTTIEVSSPIRVGYEQDTVAERNADNYGGWYSAIRDLSFNGKNPGRPILINNESHFSSIENVSFRGNMNPGVPKVQLNASLYSIVDKSDFGGQGDGLESKESTFDVAYYGTNASWFSRNNFNCNGTAAQLHGTFSFRDSTIENSGNSSGKPHFILGEKGKSSAAKSVMDFVYFECGTTTEVQSIPPLIRIDSDQQPSITNCILQYANTNHPDGDSTVLVKSEASNLGSLIFNHNIIRPVTPTVGVGKALDVNMSSYSYLEAIGNRWTVSTLRSQRPLDMYKINGVGLKSTSKTFSVYYTQRGYVRDVENGERRINMPQVDVWSDHYTESFARALRVDSSKHILVTSVVGSNKTGKMKVSSVDYSGAVTSLVFNTQETNSGDAYISGETVVFKSIDDNISASGTVITNQGTVVGVNITAGGSGYSVGDVITLETIDNNIQILDKEKWMGAEFSVHFNVAATLKNGAKYFILKSGRDIHIPAGTVMTFVIDYKGNVRQVTDVVLYGSKTYKWPSLANGAQQTTTLTVSGAEVGDCVVPYMSTLLNGTQVWAEVTAQNEVTIYHRNDTGSIVDLPSGTLRVQVTK